MTSLRTIEALVKDANAASSVADAEALVERAAAQAVNHQDWDKILKGRPAAVGIERRRALLDRARASAIARQEPWGFETVAVIEARELHDDEAARTTLRAGEQVVRELEAEKRALPLHWVILARAFHDALGDRDEARRALERGWTLGMATRDVEELGKVAVAWSKLLDREEGLARMRAIEAAAAEWGNLSGTIYWWHGIGEPAEAQRVRATIVATTTQFSEALRVARFWNLFDPVYRNAHQNYSPDIEPAFERAAALAESIDEWFALASTAIELHGDETFARRALDHAAAKITDATEAKLRVHIAAAYADWFDDRATAERIGPTAVRPDDLREPRTKLDGFASSASALFDWLRARVSDAILDFVAAGDYGYGQETYRAALESLRTTGLVPLKVPWAANEVLGLYRWSRGEGTNHVMRALACVLLTIEDDDELLNTGPILVESVLLIGGESLALLEAFLVWRFEVDEGELEAEAPAALLLLAMVCAAADPASERLDVVLRRFAAHEGAPSVREAIAGSLRAPLWTELLDRTLKPLGRPELASLFDDASA